MIPHEKNPWLSVKQNSVFTSTAKLLGSKTTDTLGRRGWGGGCGLENCSHQENSTCGTNPFWGPNSWQGLRHRECAGPARGGKREPEGCRAVRRAQRTHCRWRGQRGARAGEPAAQAVSGCVLWLSAPILLPTLLFLAVSVSFLLGSRRHELVHSNHVVQPGPHRWGAALSSSVATPPWCDLPPGP